MRLIMNRRSFLATLLAAPLAILAWTRKRAALVNAPKPRTIRFSNMPGSTVRVGDIAECDVEVFEAGEQLTEGRDFEVDLERGLVHMFSREERSAIEALMDW